MNSRERVKTTLSLKEPDRVPIDLGALVGTLTFKAQENLKKYLSISGRDEIYNRVEGTVIPNEKILEYLKVDTRYIYMNGPSNWEDIEHGNGIYEDEFGIKRKKASWYYDMIFHPLANANYPEEIEKYPWPDPRDGGRYEGLYERAKWLYENTNYAIATANTEIGSIFENAFCMVGFEKFMMDFYNNPEFNEALLDKWTDFWIGVNDELLDRVGEFIEYVTVGDDITNQLGPHISPDIYRKFIKPRQRKLFSFIKSKTKAKIYYHLCGTINEFAEDLIDIGVDILQPVQKEPKGNDLIHLKKSYGDRISFSGGISQQKTLPFGTPQEVRDEVREAISALAPGGGYLFITGHSIQPDVPAENIIAAYDEAYRFGNYPLKL